MPMTRSFAEKEFFLETFRGKTLCFALISGASTQNVATLVRCLTELVQEDIRVVLLVQPQDRPLLETQLILVTKSVCWKVVPDNETLPSLPVELWKAPTGIIALTIETHDWASFLDQTVHLALAWRMSRMIFFASQGGLTDDQGRLVTFVPFQKLSEHLRMPTLADNEFQKKLLKSILFLLSHGMGAVGLCRMEELHRELFTYEGSGTYFSCDHYCQVRYLAWDDFAQVATLIHQGIKEGFLLPRNDEQIAKILLNGFGAFLSGHHLAGVCGLFTEGYETENAGEVVGLYALTRYQGEGIGVRLVQELKNEGQKMGLDYLFSCTQQPRVIDFFQRQGFVAVDQTNVPAAKWHDYDLERKKRVRCLVFHLSRSTGQRANPPPDPLN
ncbi:MAG: GNAT family N-acetyltransferase [Magnetococcales bacterium]|nr:GNAT family N-acetyltransferase [Magnetococcales bacterium]